MSQSNGPDDPVAGTKDAQAQSTGQAEYAAGI
jgi:hypothetical protein